MSNKVFKIFSASICCLALTVGAIFTGIAVSNISNASSASVWNGDINTSYFENNTHLGRSDNPYEIDSADKLAGLASLINSSSVSVGGKYFKQTKNIILNPDYLNYENWGTTAPAYHLQWTPISNMAGEWFTGHYDGDNHTISGVYVQDTYDYASGLFGYVGYSASIKNLGISHSFMASTAPDCAGGIAGRIFYDVTIENCYVTSSILSAQGTTPIGGIVGYIDGPSSIKNCYNKSTITGSSSTGGIVGQTSGSMYEGGATIENCYNTGLITGANQNTGGIVGTTSLAVINGCYNTGIIVGNGIIGGIAGLITGTFTVNCFNLGDVNGNNDVGGIAGKIDSSNIFNSYNQGNITGTGARIGGILGYMFNYSGNDLTNCYNSGQITGTSYVGAIVGQRPNDYVNVNLCYWLQGTAASFDGINGEYYACSAFTPGGNLTTSVMDYVDLKSVLNVQDTYEFNYVVYDLWEWIGTSAAPYPHFNIEIDDNESPPDDSCLCPCGNCSKYRA